VRHFRELLNRRGRFAFAIGALAAIQQDQKAASDRRAEKQKRGEGDSQDLIGFQVRQAVQHRALQGAGQKPTKRQQHENGNAHEVKMKEKAPSHGDLRQTQ
jgi:hypothetical protein